ncbi:MAG: hypothetical protein KAJ23_17180 [Maribacter sp.]|nr:hypothetical protein [Maribacter sp.]
MNCVVHLLLEKNGYCNIHNQNGESLSKRDGMGVWETETISVKATENAHVLLMEVPMSI